MQKVKDAQAKLKAAEDTCALAQYERNQARAELLNATFEALGFKMGQVLEYTPVNRDGGYGKPSRFVLRRIRWGLEDWDGGDIGVEGDTLKKDGTVGLMKTYARSSMCKAVNPD